MKGERQDRIGEVCEMWLRSTENKDCLVVISMEKWETVILKCQ